MSRHFEDPFAAIDRLKDEARQRIQHPEDMEREDNRDCECCNISGPGRWYNFLIAEDLYSLPLVSGGKVAGKSTTYRLLDRRSRFICHTCKGHILTRHWTYPVLILIVAEVLVGLYLLLFPFFHASILNVIAFLPVFVIFPIAVVGPFWFLFSVVDVVFNPQTVLEEQAIYIHIGGTRKLPSSLRVFWDFWGDKASCHFTNKGWSKLR